MKRCHCNCHADWWLELGFYRHKNCRECKRDLLEEAKDLKAAEKEYKRELGKFIGEKVK